MTQQVYTDLESVPASEPTFGQTLVGYNFNPSGNPKVQKVKQLFAEIADIMYEDYLDENKSSFLKDKLMDHAVGEILNAQMNVVKVITL